MRFSPCGGTQRVTAIASSERRRSVSPGFARPVGIALRLVHGDEPLRRVAEDHRLLGAPGMRILMLKPAARDQHAGLDQRLDHRLVGVALLAFVGDDALAGEAGRGFGEAAVGIDGVGDRGDDTGRLELRLVRHPDVEVLAAVTGRGVDEAGAGVVGDVLAVEQRHRKVVAAAFKGMVADECSEEACGKIGDLLVARHARLLEYLAGKVLRQDEKVAELRPVVRRGVGDPIERVGDLAGEADGAVAGQRPRRRRPDDDRGAVQRFHKLAVALVERVPAPACASDRKLHPHRVAGVVLVLDLRFGERGLLHHRPHHRLRAAIEQTVVAELHQLAGDRRFGDVVHGGVGMLPSRRRRRAA